MPSLPTFNYLEMGDSQKKSEVGNVQYEFFVQHMHKPAITENHVLPVFVSWGLR